MPTISTQLANRQTNLGYGAHCPSWCVMHTQGDDGSLVHYSDVAQVVPTAGGAGEQRPIEVTLEQLQKTHGELDPAQIVLQHANIWVDPITADEALHLAGLLILAARRANEAQR